MDFNFYLIASGGYLPEVVIEKHTLNTKDWDTDEFTSFDEYMKHYVNDLRDEYEQRFATAIILTEPQFQTIQSYGK
jgi:hypothetical protein